LAGAAQPTEPTALRPGTTPLEQVAAAFPQLQVLEMIGQGGMGTVFKVRQPKLDRFAALKLLPQSLAADSAFAGRFEREARMLAKLSHPNIVSVYDYGQAGEFFYLLMEYVDGVNLRQAMRASRFEPRQALGIVPKICEALQYAHDEGVLHRDIKPENILLDARGRVKLVDFGIAKLTAEPDAGHANAVTTDLQLTQAGAALGTPSYMAPEQREHPSDVDHRADIYSLGVVFYELLTGELPAGGLARPSEKSGADPRVDAIVQQALEKERDRRQNSAGEVRTQVETLAANTGAGKTLNYAPPAPPRFSRLAILGAGCVAVLVLFSLAMYFGPAWWSVQLNPLPVGYITLLGTMILGLVSTRQIRKSTGQLRGLRLAVFDALLFPLLLVDAVILFLTFLAVGSIPHSFWSHFGPLAAKFSVLLVTLTASALADVWIIRFVWKFVRNEVQRAKPLPAMRLSPTGPLPPLSEDAAREFQQAASTSQHMESDPRFSRLAIIGAFGIVLFLAIGGLAALVPIPIPVVAWWQPLLQWGVWLTAIVAAIGTTIIGWTAVSQIRSSAGRLHGLGLAVFDGLVFPLLALDGLIFWAWNIIFQMFFPEFFNGGNIVDQTTGRTISLLSIALLLALATSALVDFVIAWCIWRALTRPPKRPLTPTSATAADTPALAIIAVGFYGMAGVLGILAWIRMPTPQQSVVWGILIAGILAVVFAIPVRKTRLGRKALIGGAINVGIWLVIFMIFAVMYGVHSAAPPANAPSTVAPSDEPAAITEPASATTSIAPAATAPDSPDIALTALGQVAPPNSGPTTAPDANGKSIVVFFTIPGDYVQEVIEKLDAQQSLPVVVYNRSVDHSKQLGRGSLVGVDNEIDPQTGTLRCKAQVTPMGDALLYPNQFVVVSLDLGRSTRPAAATQRWDMPATAP
jgi:serine/threonine protein kinase